MTPFWEDKERLQRLAGIMEDDDTTYLQAEQARQEKVVELIRKTFARLQLQLADDSAVNYFEDDNFTAVVILDIPMNEGLSIRKLNQLYSSGLSTEFTVDFAKGQGLQVQFIVNSNHRDPV
jgi:hypothetical protein